ncbi:MAG: DUF4340 domain-containing protein [Gemmatimonadetes bacterium]|nr:DUF4340 domain-containing protein [Gemmatimonadota bacterium]
MMRFPRSLRMLLAAAAILPSGCSRSADDGPPLLFPSASALPDSFVIRNDSLDFHAVPRAGALWMTRPIEDWADVQRTGTLLQIARAGIRVRVVADDVDDWSEYGLGPPRAIVRVGEESLALGSMNPTRDGMYARTPELDARLSLVGTPYASFTTLTLEEIRDRHALRFPIRDLQAIRISDRTGERNALREGERWTLEREGVRADGQSIWRIAFHLLNGTIHSFGALDSALRDTTIVVDLAWGEGLSGRVSFGGALAGTALVTAASSDRPGIFHFPGRVLDSIMVHASPLYDERLFSKAATRAGEVRVREEERAVTLVRSEDGWQRDVAGGQALPGPSARAFLRNLDSIRLEGVVPAPIAETFRESGWRIEVEGEGISIDGANDGVVLVRRDDERGVLSLDPALWRTLEAQARALLAP